MPHCAEDGLNYSAVFDKEKRMISDEMWRECGIKTEPLAYNLSQKTLKREQVENTFEFKFGDTKALIDWFIK